MRRVSTAPGSLQSLEQESCRDVTRLVAGNQRRASVRTQAMLFSDGPSFQQRLEGTLRKVENEVVLESSLHVSSLQAAACEAKFGFKMGGELPLAPRFEIDQRDKHDTYGAQRLLLWNATADMEEAAPGMAACLAIPGDQEERSNRRPAISSRAVVFGDQLIHPRYVVQDMSRYYRMAWRVRQQRRGDAKLNRLND
eukprot:gene18824-25370_t